MGSTRDPSPRRRLPIIDERALASLATACDHPGQLLPVIAPADDLGALAAGARVISAGGELLVSSDVLRQPLQAYPGASLPNLDGRDRFPIPDQPGEYCDRQEFERAPKFLAQFAHWPTRVQQVLEGNYWELAPVHFEGIFTLVCNFMCPHCTRRVTRTRWVDGGAWDNNTEVDPRNTLHPAGLRRALDECATVMVDGQMGIVWGGGDPTANPFTYAGMEYAARLGISSSFLTNGVFLEVDRCLDADPILIRVSLNCGTEEAYRRFHGYPKGWNYFSEVLSKMRELVRRKQERNARTLIGISLIIDERNLLDVVEAAREIRRVVEDSGPGVDYVIVRPVMQYKHFDGVYTKLRATTKQEALALVEEGSGEVWRILDDLGIPLIPIKDSFDEPPADELYEGTDCLSYGVCAEIRHNGDVQLCSDSYGDPSYTIGNLVKQPLREIWGSERRAEVLRRVNQEQCFKNRCPHNSRGHHFNRLFHRIEKKRRQGRIDEVEQWFEDLRETTLPLQHSFFI